MSLLTAMSSATTGIESSSTELSVIGDNIANANTVGFKAGRAAFEDALAQSVVGGVTFDGDAAQLLVGGNTVKLSDVIEITQG